MRRIGAALLVTCAIAGVARAGPAEADPDPTVAAADGTTPAADESATSVHRTRAEIQRRPHASAADLIRDLPGAAVIQPADGGPASEWLVRGLDAGAGAGLAIAVDGVPVNATSHAYTHGYADLQFVIPETIASIDLHLGPYLARHGDFAAAGALELATIDRVPGGHAMVSLGSGLQLTGPVVARRLRRRWFRLVGMASPELPRGDALIAVELGITDGPYIDPQRFRRGNLLGKWTLPIGRGRVTATTTFYSARWAQSGSLPASEIAALRLQPFGAADPSQGGIATRASASLGYADRGWRAVAYLVGSSLRLYANPTLFLVDQDAGDQREYVDRRTSYGLDSSYRRDHSLWLWRGELELGAQAQVDAGTGEVWHAERRTRLATCVTDVTNPCVRSGIRIDHLAAYVADEVSVHPRLRVRAAIRLDQIVSEIDGAPGALDGASAGARLGPRLGVVIAASPRVAIIALGAGGFQSTDARAAVDASGYGTMTRTWSGELGVRLTADRLRAAATAWGAIDSSRREWRTDLDAPTTVPAARRLGFEATLGFEPTPWLSLDASLAVARAAQRSDGTPVPLAPRLIGSGGVSVHRVASFVSLRIRGLGPRPLETGTDPRTSDSVVLVDVIAAHRWRGFELGLTVYNLLDRAWRESELVGAVRPYRGANVVDDVLVTPGVPLTAMVTLGYGR